MSVGGPIGFVGLGAIGAPLAEAIIAAGYRLVAYDRDEARIDLLTTLGAAPATSPKDVADKAETVFVSLPTPDVVREVACGETGLREGSALRTYVDLSTTGVAVATEVAAALGAHGVDVVDAPVSGGVAGARARTLAVMAACNESVFERVEPMLRSFGQNVFRVGDAVGQGQIAKLLNNLLSATAVAITSEAIAFGVASGLDPEMLLEVFNAGTGRNTATSHKFPAHVLTGRFASGFRLALMAKDLELCLAEARTKRIPLPLGGLVQQLWTLASLKADDTADHTEFVRLIEDWTQTTIAGRPHDGAGGKESA
jgi:3-hydroxyisobutyrate dehydrogenase-like beta-hydroxyacid dehydrogenase